MNTIIGTADVKARLSEFISRVRYGRERVIIARRGKPVAALVSLDDLHRLEVLTQETEQISLTEQDGVLVLSSRAESPFDDVVRTDRERRDSQLLEQTGL